MKLRSVLRRTSGLDGRVAAGVTAVTTAILLATVVVLSDAGPEPRARGSQRDTDALATTGDDADAEVASGGGSPSTASAAPVRPTTPSTDTSDATTTAPSVPAPSSTDVPASTAPPTTAPGPTGGASGDPAVTTVPEVEPSSPPAPGPPGPQGPPRSEPCAPTGPPRTEMPFVDMPSGGGSWVTVARIDGNCGATSASFATTGIDTRLLYRSDADQFLVFVDDLIDPDSAGGYADVECRSACADEQFLTTSAGEYRLRVTATDGPWELVLQELR